MEKHLENLVGALAVEMTEMETAERLALVEALRGKLEKIAADLRGHLAEEAENDAECEQDEAEQWVADALREAEGSLPMVWDAAHTERANDGSADAEAFWNRVEEILGAREDAEKAAKAKG